MELQKLNLIYKDLNNHAKEIGKILSKKSIEYTMNYYNGHYTKSSSGEYEYNEFPIPVLSTRYFDIEVGIHEVHLTTKLTRENALRFDYDLLIEYSFEVYGVKSYLLDFYNSSMNIGDIKERITKSEEQEIAIGFSFEYPLISEIENVIHFLITKKFYY